MVGLQAVAFTRTNVHPRRQVLLCARPRTDWGILYYLVSLITLPPFPHSLAPWEGQSLFGVGTPKAEVWGREPGRSVVVVVLGVSGGPS